MAKRQDWWEHGVLNADKIREVGLDPDDRSVQMTLRSGGATAGLSAASQPARGRNGDEPPAVVRERSH